MPRILLWYGLSLYLYFFKCWKSTMSAMTAQKTCSSYAATNHKLAEIVIYAVNVENMHNMWVPLGVKQV